MAHNDGEDFSLEDSEEGSPASRGGQRRQQDSLYRRQENAVERDYQQIEQ